MTWGNLGRHRAPIDTLSCAGCMALDMDNTDTRILKENCMVTGIYIGDSTGFQTVGKKWGGNLLDR